MVVTWSPGQAMDQANEAHTERGVRSRGWRVAINPQSGLPARVAICFGRSIAVPDRCQTESDGSSRCTSTQWQDRGKSTPAKTFFLRRFKGLTMLQSYDEEVSLALLAQQCRNLEMCIYHLERAHVLAQRMTFRHAYIDWLMLLAGLRQRDVRKVVGQVPRMLASVLFSRLWAPHGNTGRSRSAVLKPMPVPEDLCHLFS